MKAFKFFLLIISFELSILAGISETKDFLFSNEQFSYSFQECFEKKIKVYIQKLQIDLLQNNPTHLRLHKIILHAQCYTKLKQMLVLFHRADKITEKYEPIKILLLLRASVLLWRYTYQMLLDLLVIVDNHLSYWRAVRDDSNYYFLQKPLMKMIGYGHWSQDLDMDKRIQSLSLIQKKCFKGLGEFATQVQQFNGHATADECYEWLKRFLLVTQSFSMRSQINIDEQENIIKNIQQASKNILNYREYALSIIKQTKPPSYWRRNWEHYALCMMGVYVVYKNRRLMSQWIDKGAKNIFYDYFVLPMKSLYEIILEHKKPKKLAIVGDIREKEKLIFQNKKLLKEQKAQVEKYIFDVKKRKNITLESINKDLQQKEKDGFISTENREKIIGDLEQNDTSSLQQFINNLPKNAYCSLSNLSIEVVAIQSMWNLVQFIFFNDGQKIMNDTRNMFNHALQELINVDESLLESRKVLAHYMDLLDREFSMQQMTLRLTALMPPALFLWGISKLASNFYSRFKRNNENQVKNILSRIKVLLITCRGNMTSECYGKYLYLLYVLQCSITCISQQSVKLELLRDIAILSSNNTKVKEKLFLIDNMCWHYSFLVPLHRV